MNNPTHQQALEWCTEWMQQNHPDVKTLVSISSINWGDEFREYIIYQGKFEELRFKCVSIEVGSTLIFDFIIPPTKDEFFTVLRILDK